jgi:dinuclear metal center YbgI/SA1388 family protein
MQKKTTVPQKVSVSRNDLLSYLDTILKTSQIKDYSCNGLQVQGCDTIYKVALVVDASLEAYKKAVKSNCQCVIAHHGIIWDGIKSISGAAYMHIKYLLDNNLNLYASHLPLDLHPQLGNNAGLVSMLKLKNIRTFGMYKGIEIGFEGEFTKTMQMDSIVEQLCEKLDTECTVLPFGKKEIKSVAIVSGGAGSELTEAIEKGVDCYITGEPVHQNYHAALEAGINVIYAGHYHTEKPGVQALGKSITAKFGIEAEFIDIPTTV